MSAQRIRPATLSDIDALDAIEKAVFAADRISRRSFRTLIDRPTAETLVLEAGGEIRGYAMILFRAGAALARLYSLAVAPARPARAMAGRFFLLPKRPRWSMIASCSGLRSAKTTRPQ
jgi:N-acetylglutamate synthase-like GNAT family acetyltransferase